MRTLNFNKCGIYMTFGVGEEEGLLLLKMSSCEGTTEVPENKLFTALEVNLTGYNPDDHHGAKKTGGCAPDVLKYISHEETDTSISFVLESKALRAKLTYDFCEGAKVVKAYSEITNISTEPIGVENVSSICIYGFDMESVYLPHNAWCREMDWRKYSPKELGYSPINKFSTKRICATNTGTWSTKEYLPMGCVESENDTIMWQIENNGSWNWEISDLRGELYLKAGGPSERDNGWWKNLKPGESFETVAVAVAIVSGGFEEAVQEMTEYRRTIACRSEEDKYLPVIFNDFMCCLMSDPTTEKELPLIDAAAKAGAEIFCMDAGWYSDGTWWETVGEWKVFEPRFPNGMKEVFDYIREKGMKPGIWLEPEVMGIDCPILDQFDDDCFFTRHGKRVIDHGRYLLDFRSKKVRDFLDGIVDGLVRDYGIKYFKFDYNIDGGLGTEVNADSFGDGLMQHAKAFLEWVDGICERYPGMIIENCSSGGLRMDYKSLSHFSLQSLTDAMNMENVSTIAAMSSTAVIPEQAAVWCIPFKSQTDGEMACNMVSAMFRRIHLAGETAQLSDGQFEIIKEAIDFYKQTRHLIPKMKPFYPMGIINHEDKIKCCGYKCDEKTYVCIINLDDKPQKLKVPVGDGYKNGAVVYPAASKCKTKISGCDLKVSITAKSGVVIEIN